MQFLKDVRDGINKYLIMSFNALPKFVREFLIGKNNRAAGDDFYLSLPNVTTPEGDKPNVLKGDQLGESGGIDNDTADKQNDVLNGMKSALEETLVYALQYSLQVLI